MANVGRPFQIRGEIQTADDLTIEGYVEGLVWSDGLAVTVGADAEVHADIIARDITVFGRVVGSLIASGAVHICDSASVTGRIIAASFVLAEGASFSGLVQPPQIENVEGREVARAIAKAHLRDSSASPSSRGEAVSAA